MWSSLLPSQRAQVAAAIPPQSTSTTVTSGWVSAALWEWFLAVINVGTISSGGSINAKLMQAQDDSGTNAKELTDAAGNDLAITALTQAASQSDMLALINARAANLDTNNGFTFIELSVTASGAAALVAGTLLGFDPKIPTADSTGNGADDSAVAQIVGQP